MRSMDSRQRKLAIRFGLDAVPQETKKEDKKPNDVCQLKKEVKKLAHENLINVNFEK